MIARIVAIVIAVAAVAATVATALGSPLNAWESLVWVWVAVAFAALAVLGDRA